MPTVYQQILALLADPHFHDDFVDDDLSDAVASLASDVGWQPVLNAMLDVLRDSSLTRHWYDVVACLFACDCHTLPLPCDRSYITALLYDCLRICPDLGIDGRNPDDTDNLVWSIVHNLKGVSYMSDYDPKTDAEVLQHQIVR
ncbi:hypothetical protein [Novipirellula caenicola]|uniref:hypothetical protein n=1 Tax=Novipirellula caenicola TaxID=1536901 RepID=UPI0031E6FC84